jgi:uncharacterized Zn-binding protein involved in type VI secretion
MKSGIIVQGDALSSGGIVLPIERPKPNIMNMPWACMGDKVSCPIPSHGAGVIIEGCDSLKINGLPIALQGHKVSCGCTLVASQFGARLTLDAPEKTTYFFETNYKKFLMKDNKTFDRLQNIPYEICTEKGDIRRGHTCEIGESKVLRSQDANCELILKLQNDIEI